MPLIKFGEISPIIGELTFIAQNAFIIGDVTIGADSSVWHGCTIRGDVNRIVIGESTNIQDGTTIHVGSHKDGSTIIGQCVTVGHSCLLHACTLMDNTFVGMGSLIMDGALIEENAMLGAGSLLTEGKHIRSGELWLGRPAKFARRLTTDEISHIRKSAEKYSILARQYMR
ncbi:hexapeptide transferase family protein [Neorickettsia helminthoeca str. Oregon]|uniref:Hexapeptide transferase family protein n=1 Tax=Neorickettsia helminthoeca str. Oregon TaxID=1286528 RepID=X5GVG8_9RICK|nr:gamma carbonic anhydrase family protein [Neorickettsia helminthoeca]AHX11022.1 hexapeptide transferase family protein [Neorickettsia helminthoeca str. Oregon]